MAQSVDGEVFCDGCGKSHGMFLAMKVVVYSPQFQHSVLCDIVSIVGMQEVHACLQRFLSQGTGYFLKLFLVHACFLFLVGKYFPCELL